MPVLDLDAAAAGAKPGGEFLGDGNRPVPASAAQDMDVRAMAVRKSQQRHDAVETPLDQLVRSNGRQDVVPYLGVETVGAQHSCPDGGIVWRVAQWTGIDAQSIAAGSIMVALSVAGDDGPDESSTGLSW